MNLNLEGKSALVCGSTQGIGKSIAIELAEFGANVTLVARNEEALKIVLAELDKTKNQKHQYFHYVGEEQASHTDKILKSQHVLPELRYSEQC